MRKEFHGAEWFKKTYGITISTHSGKLSGMQSLSTSCMDNPRCALYAKCEGSICEKCYARNYQTFRGTLKNAMMKNGEVLREKLLDEYPILNAAYFRIESFGDVANVTQARNYIRLAKRNPQTTFGWWTKNPDIVDAAILLEGRPENIVFIISSVYQNRRMNPFKRYPWVDKVFTVYTEDYIEEHRVSINCGENQCMGCLQCYKRGGCKYINEKIK